MRGVEMGRIRARLLLAGLGCVALGLAACSGPNNETSISTSSGFSAFLTVTPNAIPALPPGSTGTGGCATLNAKVFDTHGQLVDGARVLFNTTLGIFPKQQGEDQDAVARSRFTVNGIATEVICAQAVRGTAIITATVEDAHTTVLLTIF